MIYCRWIFALLIASACSSISHPESDEFQPEQIACTNKSSPELAAKLLHTLQHAGDEVNNLDIKLQDIGHIDSEHRAQLDRVWNRISEAAKKPADQGNPRAMMVYGEMQREIMLGDYMAENYAETKEERMLTMPEFIKKDMVVALTYIYISYGLDQSFKGNVIDLVNDIERTNIHPKSRTKFTDTSFMPTPSEWIAEAKANRDRWIAYCK